MNELLQTADHYRKHPDKLEKLTDTELETLKNTLGDLFCAVHAPLKKANFATYKKEVIRLTANNLQILPQFRAKSVLDAQMYVIDHKIPAILGYKKGLKAELVASSGSPCKKTPLRASGHLLTRKMPKYGKKFPKLRGRRGGGAIVRGEGREVRRCHLAVDFVHFKAKNGRTRLYYM